MRARIVRSLVVTTAVAGLVIAIASLLACASAEPTATPVPPAEPAAPLAPTAAPGPAPTVAASPATPTAVVAQATPTRVLPTATSQAAEQVVYGGTLRFAHALNVDNLDPAFNALPATYQIFYAVYDQLFRLDRQSALTPGLAESWEFSPDGSVLTLRLRAGAKFHDGTALNAQAVKWNFDRMMDPKELSARRTELEPYLKKVEVLDENTVRLTLTNAYRPFLPELASERIGWLVSPAAVQKFGGGKDGKYGRNPVGSGPFRFSEWVLDTYVKVEKNTSYWEKGKPYLDAILYQGVMDASARIAMLRTGETDMVYSTDFRPQDAPLVERQAQLRLVRVQGAATYILHFNASKLPYDNRALRQAISYAVDRQKFVDVVFDGAGKPAYTLIAAGWANNPDLKPITFDLAKAKQKLTEAGYPQGVTIPMGCRTSGVYLLFCEFIQATLKQANINATIEIVPAADYASMDEKGAFRRQGLSTNSWGHRVDPHTLTQILFHKDGFRNLGAYNNPELNRLIDEAARVYDVAKAKPLYDKIQTMAAEEAVAPFLGWPDRFYPMSQRVQGFIPYPTGFEHLEFLWLQR